MEEEERNAIVRKIRYLPSTKSRLSGLAIYVRGMNQIEKDPIMLTVADAVDMIIEELIEG